MVKIYSLYVAKNKNKKLILKDMKYITSYLGISLGLMMRGKKTIEKGVCLVLPKESILSCAVTMVFCLHSMDILFVNSSFEVVDKITLKPWRLSYTPKDKCKYIIESIKGKFKGINIGDKVIFI